MRCCEYSVVVVDEVQVESDPGGAELLWRQARLAIPLQFNFAISGTARLVREIRAALTRREQEQALSMRAAALAVESELRDTVAKLAGSLRQRLRDGAHLVG